MSDFTIPHLHASEGFTRAYTRLWIELREALDVFHWNIGVLIIQTQSAGVDYVPEYFMNVMGFFLMSNPETIELGCNWHEFRLTTRRKIPTFEACRCRPQYILDKEREPNQHRTDTFNNNPINCDSSVLRRSQTVSYKCVYPGRRLSGDPSAWDLRFIQDSSSTHPHTPGLCCPAVGKE